MKPAIFRFPIFFTFFLTAVTLNLFADPVASPRERLLMDFGWKFHLGNEWGDVQGLAKADSSSGPAGRTFGDTGWRTVNLPHDWAVELPFDAHSDMAHGYKPVGPGFPQNDVGWYRRTFELPKEDSGKRLWLEFDGVFRNCDIFVNGWSIGHQDSGYTGFRYDITDVANYGGKNYVAVKVDVSQFEGWFYEGAGIYRHVWLEKTAPVALAPDGIFVYSKFKNNVPTGKSEINIEAHVLNTLTNAAGTTVKCEIISPDGKLVAKDTEIEKVEGAATKIVKLAAEVSAPVLWSPESPRLYKLVTTVEVGGQMVDRKETEFGIRTVAFDPTNGFLLNGQPYVIKGTCNHQDMAGVGAALPDALQYFRIAKLKEFGDNALRTSHNAPMPELLDACDHLGMLVLDENRLVGSDAANLERLKGQIIRDRNHPGVFAWSLGNEEWNSQGTVDGAAVIRTMQDLAHSLDPTRPCTAAVNGSYGETGFITVLDVKGFNYNLGSIDHYRSAHSNANFIGTETASTVTTRGIYTNDTTKGYVAAYDFITTKKSKDFPNPVNWGETAEQWWSFYAARPWLSGGFAWTGFDYRGEPTPYEWPCINSHFGIMDMCGFPKDNFYYYQSWWTTNIVLHLLPHWNWPGREGQDIRVDALSNCGEVELFLNGVSLGKQTMKHDSKLTWNVKYAPGTLSAKGYDDGKLVAETKVETTGEPAAVQLKPDRTTINADGEDVSVFTVSVADSQGRIVPVAANGIRFDLAGPGKIIGVGNGDPSCHEPDIFLPQSSVRSVPVNDGWRWKKLPNVNDGRLAEVRANYDDSSWDTTDVSAGNGQLSEQEQAVFRANIQVSEQDLTAPAIELHFGSIDDDGTLYVNGRRIGESHDWQLPAVFDIKSSLHPGTNTIAVAVQNRNGSGGLNKSVTLQFAAEPTTPEWKRSAFNGLAQVMVQSSKEAGEIKLTAQADGLTPATLAIQSQAGTPRPFVP
jgi:beta-galactosidase